MTTGSTAPSPASLLMLYPQRDGVYDLLADSVIVHDRRRNRVLRLDAFTTEIWMRIDGTTTLQDIAADIAVQRSQPLEPVARVSAAIVDLLATHGLIVMADGPAPLPYHLTSPLSDQDKVRSVASMRDAGWV